MIRHWLRCRNWLTRKFDGAEHASFTIGEGRLCYVHLARGALHVAGLHLEAGDGLKVTEGGEIEFREGKSAEVLVFDLPPQP